VLDGGIVGWVEADEWVEVAVVRVFDDGDGGFVLCCYFFDFGDEFGDAWDWDVDVFDECCVEVY